MLQPRTSILISSREVSLASLATALNNLSFCSRHAPPRSQVQITFARHASHAAQGRANGPKDSAGRRLGAKKTASQYVIPGNIIFKQRGTKWFPGENVGIGSDHTIYSKVYGYVRYYRNPTIHPKRRYIGVALEKEGAGSQLPTPPNAPTRRRLGMFASPIKDPNPVSQEATSTAFLKAHMANANERPKLAPTPPAAVPTAPLALRRGGFGIANFEIGRAAERAGKVVPEFDRKNRWKAWRIRAAKVKVKMMNRAARASRKTKGKKSNKKVV